MESSIRILFPQRQGSQVFGEESPFWQIKKKQFCGIIGAQIAHSGSWWNAQDIISDAAKLRFSLDRN
jgi:hypothetical protein